MRITLLLSCTALCGLAWISQDEPSALRTAARAFAASLDERDLSNAVFPFHAPERRDWHYVPRQHRGVAFRDLQGDELAALRKLLRTTLSAAGERKLDEIVALEDVLRERESTPEEPATWRDAGAYAIALFGDVGGVDPWGWRLEGHHVVLHFTEVGRELSITPHFLGTNPARSEREGKVIEPLALEQALGRQLALALTGNARDRAVLSAPVPEDIVNGPGQDVAFDPLEGVGFVELDEPTRALAESLLEVFVGRFDGESLVRARALVEPRDSLRFVWIGSTEPGQPHYYRIHSPRLSIEYHNGQDNANHVHTLWRERETELGGPLAEEHERKTRAREQERK